MNQLALNLEKSLIYTPEKFFLHSGVLEVFNEVIEGFRLNKFQSSFVFGPSRIGKTHLSLAIQNKAEKEGKKAVFINSEEFPEWAKFHLTKSALNADVIIIDDIDLYFFDSADKGSGLFVNFIEQQRKKKSKVILMSGTKISELSIDNHISSRLNEANQLNLKHPDFDELGKLLDLLALQRGYKLNERHKAYILKRMERSTQAFEYLLLRLDELILEENQRVGISLLKRAVE